MSEDLLSENANAGMALAGQPACTVPATVQIHVLSFAEEEAAQRLAGNMAVLIKELGTFLDLSTLDGITVSTKYSEALLSLDRGVPGMRPLSRSNTESMQGVAMAPMVMREGVPKTHVLFDAFVLHPLYAKDGEASATEIADTIATVAHECAHVEVNSIRERLMRNHAFGTRVEGFEKAVMFQVAEVCWEEYTVCKLIAPLSKSQVSSYSESLLTTLTTARDRSNEFIKSYRTHGDLERLIAEAGPELCQPIKVVSYLLGTMDGLKLSWDDKPEVRAALLAAGYSDLVDRLLNELRNLAVVMSEEKELDLSGLEEIAHDVFVSGGLFFSTTADGLCNVEVPFSPHTMP